MNKKAFLGKLLGFLVVFVIILLLFFASKLISVFTFSDESLIKNITAESQTANASITSSMPQTNNTEDIIINSTEKSNSTNKSYIIEEVP